MKFYTLMLPLTLMSHGEEGFIKMKDGEKVSLKIFLKCLTIKIVQHFKRNQKIFIRGLEEVSEDVFVSFSSRKFSC